MTVNTYDPSAGITDFDPSLARALLESVGEVGDEGAIELNSDGQLRFAPLVTHGQWKEVAAQFSSEECIALVKIFTLGEMTFPGWIAEDKSAVIPLVKALKAKGGYDKTLTRWIKAHTSNKFLPHGSLADRL
jgi:hypothetical protein